MQNQDYDFRADQEVDFNEQTDPPPQPPLDESMLEASTADLYESLDNLDEYAAQNAMPQPQNIPAIPEHILESTAASMLPDPNVKLSDFSLFLNEKYDELNAIASAKNPSAPPIGHDSAFEKNIQSQWFVEYNKIKAENGEKQNMLLCKSNGHFYSDRDTPESALKDYGFNENEAQALAPHMAFTFIGNTEIKGNKGKGLQRGQFKTFVLSLKDPNSAASLDALAEIVAQKTKHVQSHIDNTYNLDTAKEKILSRVDGLIQAETAKTGVTPFVGVWPALFLNNRAVYERLSEIPEIKDQFKIEPLDVNGNKMTYTGFSEGLNSYFNAELKLHKVTTKDPDVLPQSELESIIAEHLKNEKEPLMMVPEQDNDKIIEKQHDKNVEKGNTNDNAKINEGAPPKVPEKSKNATLGGDEISTKQKFNNAPNPNQSSDDGEDEEGKKKRKRDSEDKRMSVGEIALRAIQKLAEKSLKAILRLAQMIVMALLALIRSLLAFGNKKMTKAFGTKPYFEAPNLADTFKKNDFINNLFEKKLDGPSKKKDQELDKKNDIRDALDDVFADKKNTDPELADAALKNSLAQNLSALGTPTELDLLKEAALKSEQLSDGVKDALKLRAQDELLALSDDDKKKIIAALAIPALHRFGEDLKSQVAPTLMYDETHGVLLAKGDEVQLEDGTKAGVLAAYDVGGALYYAVANESEDKNYQLNYVEAAGLTLLGHNKLSFDNEENLIAQANHSVLEQHKEEHEGKIQNIDILDYDSPQATAINVEQLAEKLQLIPDSTNNALKPINYLDEYEKSTLKENYEGSSIYQLHHDKTNSLVSDPDHGQQHPVFGKLLDLNDAVQAKLPQSGMMIEGTVMGAYIHGNQLYYSIDTDKNSYNLPASDLTLTEINGGRLDTAAIEEHLNTQNWANKNYNREHQYSSDTIVLSHNLAPSKFNTKNGVSKGAWVRSDPTDLLGDVGIKPLVTNELNEYLGANNIYSVIEDGKKRSFVSIGQTTDEATGQKHSIVLEIKKNGLTLGGYAALSASKSALKTLDMDNPAVVFEKEGASHHLSGLIEKTREMYETGSARARASLIHHLSNQISTKHDFKQQAESFYKDKIIASNLLVENALNAFNGVKDNTLGLDANLTQTKILDEKLTQALSQPESQVILSENGRLTSNDYKPNTLLPNTLTFSNPNTSFDSLDNLMQPPMPNTQPNFKALGESFVTLNGASLIEQAIKHEPVLMQEAPIHAVPNLQIDTPKHDELQPQAKALDSELPLISTTQEPPIEVPETLATQLAHRVAALPSDLPESVLMRVALTYVTGDRYCSNQEGGIDLLNTKELLAKEREKINQDIIQLMPKIKSHLEGVNEYGQIESISSLKINDFDGLKKLLNEDPEISSRLNTILNKESILASSVENHLDKVESRLEKIHNKLDLKEFDMENIKTLNSVSDVFLDAVKNDCEQTKSVSDLVSILKEVKNADGDLKYSDIAIKVVNDGINYTNDLSNHLSSMHSSFKPKTNYQVFDQAKKLENDKSFDFNQ